MWGNVTEGDVRYASPEMVEQKNLGLEHDIWSLGVLAYFLFAGHFPFEGESEAEINKKILESEPDWEVLKARSIDASVVEVIRGMLVKNVSKRWSLEDITRSEAFSHLEDIESQVQDAVN